jgi:hypothetical protein
MRPVRVQVRHGGYRELDEKTLERIRTAITDGVQARDVAARFALSPHTVTKLRDEMGLKKTRRVAR